MKKIDLIAAVLVLVGASTGVSWRSPSSTSSRRFGMEFGETNVASRIVYGLVGLAGVYGVVWLASRRSAAAIRPRGLVGLAIDRTQTAHTRKDHQT